MPAITLERIANMRLTKPDESEIKAAHRALYVGKSQKAVAAPEIGKAIFGMIYRHVAELGLVDVEALDIVKAATEKLAAIDEAEIKGLSDNERTLLIADVSQLESIAGWVKSTTIRIRSERTIRRGTELNGEPRRVGVR